MQRLLRRACHVTNSARERGVPLRPRLIECFERRYDAILAEGLAFHETQLPLVRAVIKAGGKGRGRAPRRISSCASRSTKKTRYASFAIRPFPSPLIRPNATGA